MLIIQKSEESVDHFFFERKKTKAKLKDNQQIVMVRPSKLEIKNRLILHNFFFCFVLFPACGTVINLATYKEHAIECKGKLSKVKKIIYFSQ